MQVATPWQAAQSPVWWRQNLAWGIGLLALLLAGSALVSWVAANWPHMASQTRLALVQGGLALSVLLAAGLAWRDSRWVVLLTGTAALGVGGLLALVGQIYQTGADRWQLFLLWAVLITPWLLLMRSVFLALLWAALLNLSLWLIVDQGLTHRLLAWWGAEPTAAAAFLLVGLNAGLLVLAECLGRRLQDPWRLIRRALAMAVLGWAFIAAWQGMWMSPHRAIASGQWAALAAVAVLYGVYAYWRRDLAIVALSLLVGIGVIGVWWFQLLGSFSGILGLGVLLLALTSLAVRHVMQLRRAMDEPATDADGTAADPHRQAISPWYLTVLRLGAMTPALLLLGLWVAINLELKSAADAWLAGGLLMLPGLLMDRLLVRDVGREIGAVLMVLGLMLCAGGAVLLMEDGGSRAVSVLALTATGAVAYVLTRQFGMRLAAAILVLGVGFWLTGPDAYGVAWSSDMSGVGASHLAWRLWAFLAAGTGLWVWSVRAVQRTAWRPLAWALMIMAAGVALLIAQSMPASARDWPWFGQAAMFLCALLPGLLLAAWMSTVRPVLPTVLRAGVPLVCCAAGLGWVDVPVLSVALVCLILGRMTGGRVLQVLSVPLGMVGLLLYYLDMRAGSLVDKAAILGVTAACLAVLVAVLAARHRQTAARTVGVRRSWLAAGVLAGGLLVLGVAQAQVRHYETILSQGVPVVLALAPADPRSLMQGDYMILDYAVRRAADGWLQRHPDVGQDVVEAGRGWLLLRSDEQGVWQLQGVATNLPSAASDVVALAFRWRTGRVDIGAKHWFFAEGQGARFAQAMYGVLRVDADGAALLAGLLDEQRQPL